MLDNEDLPNTMKAALLADNLNEMNGVGLGTSLGIAIKAGFYGMGNNIKQLGAWASGDAPTDLTDIAAKIEESYGSGGLASYQAHEIGYNLAGDLITSFVPVAGAMKFLKVAKAGALGETARKFAMPFGLEAAATRNAAEMANLYKIQGSAASVASQRTAVYGYSAAQQAYEGALVSAAVEISLNAGDILNDEGRTATEKLLTLGSSIALGAGIQGLVGGFFAGRALTKSADRVGAQVYKQDEVPFLYNAPTRGNPSVTGNSAADALFEWERIDRIAATNPLQVSAKSANIEMAKLDFNTAINKLFPADAAATTVNPVRNTLLKWSETSQGRVEALNVLGRLNKITALKESTFSVNGAMQKLLAKASKVEFVDDATFKAASANSAKRFHMDGDTLKINRDADMTLIESQEALAHYTAMRSNANKIDIPKYEVALNRFKLANNLDNADEFDVLKAAFAARAEDSLQFSKDYSGIEQHFRSIGIDVADATYAPKSVAYLDSVNNTIIEQPLVHLGDITMLNHTRHTGTIGWISADGLPKAYTRQSVASIGSETDLLAYQAKRVLAAENPLLISSLPADLKTIKPEVAYSLEAHIANKAPVANKAGEMIYKVNGKELKVDDVHEAIATVKAAEYNRLFTSNPALGADVLGNTLGVSEKFIIARGKLGTFTTSLNTTDNVGVADLIVPAENLLQRRTYALEYTQNSNQVAVQNADIFAHLESARAQDLAILRANVDNLVFNGQMAKAMPDSLNIESVLGYGTRRFYTNAAQIGDYDSLISRAVRIGDMVLRASENVFQARIFEPLKSAASPMLKSQAARSEYAALKEWYYQQDAKFYFLDSKTLVSEHVYSKAKALLQSGASVDGIVKQLTPNVEYMSITSKEVEGYVQTIHKLNKTEVAAKKVAISNLMGKDTSINPNAFYMPPRNYKHMTFIVESANSPMSPTSHNVFRIVAETPADLKRKVNDALLHAKQNNLNWAEYTSSNISDYKAARMVFEWEGEQLTRGFSNPTMQRTGAVPALTPEVDATQLVIEEAEWFKRQVMSVHRAGIQMYYADDISKMTSVIRQEEQRLASNLDVPSELKVRFGKGVPNYKKPSDIEQVLVTALGGDNVGFNWWRQFNNLFEEWSAKGLTVVNQAFYRLKKEKSFQAWAEEGKRVEEELRKKGIGVPLGNYVADRLARETTLTPDSIKKGASTLTMLQSTLLMRLDHADAVVNTLGAITKIGGELQYLKEIANSTGRAAELETGVGQLFNTGVNGITLASSAKAYANAIKSYWSAEGKQNLDNWYDMGLAVSDAKFLRGHLDDLKIDSSSLKTADDMQGYWNKVAETGGKIVDIVATPTKHSNLMGQYAALYIADKLGKAAGLQGKQLAQFMFEFNRRTNAITNPLQKPRLFQGAIGTTISLYQSYMFHMMNNIFRYADKGIKSAPAMIAALNGTFFGAQSLPGFNLINEHIASRTEGHNDLFVGAAAALNSDINSRDAMDFVMYGAASTLLQGAFYTRGSLQPRSPVLVPTSLTDVPTIAMLGKIISSATETVQRISYGDNVAKSVLDGIVDVGMNRPLKGLRDLVQGKATDGNYNTVIFHDDISSVATAVRVLGLQPMNQAITRDYQARLLAYRADDAKRKIRLGEEIRRVYDSSPDALEDSTQLERWRAMYMKAGGRSSQFNSFLEDQLFKGENDLSVRLEKMLKTNHAARSGFNTLMGNE